MTMDYVLWIVLIALGVGTLGFQTCSEVHARSEAREEAPLVGVVDDVEIVSAGGLLASGQDIYLQIDDEVYKYVSEDPVPAEGSIIEYRVVDDHIFDVVKIDGGDEDARGGGVSAEENGDQGGPRR